MAVLYHRYRDTAEGGTVRIPAGATDFPPLQNVQTASEAHPASYSMRIVPSPPGDEAAGAWR